MQFRVGVLVFGAVVTALLLVVLISPAGWIPWGGDTYRVAILLNEAPGIGPGTPVRKNGILIGRVDSIEDLDDRVRVWANINEGTNLFREYTCQVRTSVLGDATVDFVTRRVPPETPPLVDGAEINGEVMGNPLNMIANLQDDLALTMNSLARAGDAVAVLAERVDTAFGDETETGRVSRLLTKTEQAMDQFTSSMQSADDFFGDDQLREQFKQGLAEMPAAVRETRIVMQNFGEVLELAETNLRYIQGFTEPLGRNGEQIAQAILDSVTGVERLLEEFTLLSQALNSREGAIGRLIHEPQFYENLNRLVANSNHVVLRVNDLTLRLQPVVDDARVFMDKIAREPGRLVGGALNKGPGIK